MSRAPNVNGEEGDEKQLTEIDPAVRYVATGGYWRDKNLSGDYRIVVLAFGEDHLVYETYAQWVYFDGRTGKSAVLASTKIAELTDRVGAVVKNPRFLPRSSESAGTVAEVEVATEHPLETSTVRIRLKEPGVYLVE